MALPKSKAFMNSDSASGVPVPTEIQMSGDVVPETQATEPSVSGLMPQLNETTRPNYDGIKDLVIVCCHAIFHPDINDTSFPLHSPYDESNWHLAPFQKSNPNTDKPGEHETFMGHITAGLDSLTIGRHYHENLLILSGAATKSSLTPLSEAQSYYHAALAHELSHGHTGGGRTRELFSKGRILLEEDATDSFQNLLFSIVLFRRTTGVYPKHVRIITHAFKSKRFLELHAPAIQWPSNCIQVQGIDPVMSSVELEDTIRGEEKFGYAAWVEDPLGAGETLSKKRRQRGWDESKADDLGGNLEISIKDLLRGKKPPGVPWNQSKQAGKESV